MSLRSSLSCLLIDSFVTFALPPPNHPTNCCQYAADNEPYSLKAECVKHPALSKGAAKETKRRAVDSGTLPMKVARPRQLSLTLAF